MASVALDTMPPWPGSSPNRRSAMSFVDTLLYDDSDPYGAPNPYESTLTSIIDTDFPLQSSPSRRGVLSRSSSSRSVFGDSTNTFANKTDTVSYAGATRPSDDSLENFSSGLRYAPSDLTGSVSDVDSYDALEETSTVPGSPAAVYDSATFAADAATYTTIAALPALADEPLALVAAPEQSIGRCAKEVAAAPEAERAGEEKGSARYSFAEVLCKFHLISPGLLSPEPSPLNTAPAPTTREQSPASALEVLAQPSIYSSSATYPAPSYAPSRDEHVVVDQDAAAQDGSSTADGVENNDAEYNGRARDGAAAEDAQLILPAAPPATIPENDQTKPRRKAKKSKGKGKVAGGDVIVQPASHAPADAPASHSSAHDDSLEYAAVIEQQRQAKKARKARGTKGRAAVDSAVNAAVGIAASAPVLVARSPAAVVRSAQPIARAHEPAAAQGHTRSLAATGNAAAGAAQAFPKAQGKPPASKSQQVLAKTSGVAAPPTASMAMSSSMPAPAQALGTAAASMAPRVTSGLYHGHAVLAAAPNAASFAPHPSLSNSSMGTPISSRPPAPPTHASRGSSTGPMLWQALMKGELTMEEMQARLRSDVKSPPALEGARADVLRSVTLSEGPPAAPPSFRSPGIGASSVTPTGSMGHSGASSSSTTLSVAYATSPTGIKRKHGHDAEPEDPNRKQCGWTHFDAQNKPMGPCTHFFNKKSDREKLRKNVRDHMRTMEPNRCDAIYCQWAHDCKRHNRYFGDLYAAVEHIVDIILGTETRVRR